MMSSVFSTSTLHGCDLSRGGSVLWQECCFVVILVLGKINWPPRVVTRTPHVSQRAFLGSIYPGQWSKLDKGRL